MQKFLLGVSVVPAEGTNQVKPSPKGCGVRPHLSTRPVSKDKTRTINNKLDILYSTENKPCMGECRASEVLEHRSQEAGASVSFTECEKMQYGKRACVIGMIGISLQGQ